MWAKWILNILKSKKFISLEKCEKLICVKYNIFYYVKCEEDFEKKIIFSSKNMTLIIFFRFIFLAFT